MIMPDIIPNLDKYESEPAARPYCVYVNAFAEDEPAELVFQVAEKLQASGVKVYWTNKPPKGFKCPDSVPENLVFTGYLSDGDYFSLIAKARCVLALTNEEGCLQCAGYEATALGVPVVISDTRALRGYFGNAGIFVKHELDAIVAGILFLTDLDAYHRMRSEVRRLEGERRLETGLRQAEIERRIGTPFVVNGLK